MFSVLQEDCSRGKGSLAHVNTFSDDSLGFCDACVPVVGRCCKMSRNKVFASFVADHADDTGLEGEG